MFKTMYTGKGHTDFYKVVDNKVYRLEATGWVYVGAYSKYAGRHDWERA